MDDRAGRRAEAEEDERLAARDWLRRRDLGDVALELLHRGDTVEVHAAGRIFRGTVVYACGDLAIVRTAAGEVDIRLGGPLLLSVTERAPEGGTDRSRGPETFTARLFEHEAAAAPVALGCWSRGEELVGQLEAVAGDHVVVDTPGARWHVARAAIAYVRATPRSS